MTMTSEIGKLLIALDNATTTVWGDDACITHIIPSPKYKETGVLLDITISVFKHKYSDYDYEIKTDIWNSLIYDSVFNYANALLKVDIHFKEM